MINVKRTTPPAVSPITLADVKKANVLDERDDDAEIERLIEAAVSSFDGWRGILGRCMVNQGWSVGFEKFQRVMKLPFPDVSTVAVGYKDAAGADQVVDPADYEIVDLPGGPAICFRHDASFPAIDAGAVVPITIDFTAGFGPTAEDVPAAIRAALVAQVIFLFEEEPGFEDEKFLSYTAGRHIRGYRWVT